YKKVPSGTPFKGGFTGYFFYGFLQVVLQQMRNKSPYSAS
ncbi:hypothetical protein BSG1_10588, partial [Bacillus sp. SG-1]